MSEIMSCPNCEATRKVELLSQEKHILMNGKEIKFQSRSYHCPHCGEEFDTAETLDLNLERAREAYDQKYQTDQTILGTYKRDFFVYKQTGEDMKRFYFLTDVKAASGWQRWYVDAETLYDAKAAHDRGEFEFDCEEVEIESLGDPEWDPDVEVED